MSDLTAYLAEAEAAANEAGALIRRHFRTPIPVDCKPDASPVTLVDQEAERLLRRRLGAGGLAVVGEEQGGTIAKGGRCWVVDPIDGTRAFVTGRPLFGTLIALLEDGVPVLGLIDQCVTGERWIGQRGAPTRFRGPLGGVAGTRACATLAKAELSTTSPELFAAADAPRFARLARAACRVSYGGDCYAYGLLALGRIDVIAEAGLKPWDWAALVPVIEGAGGRITDWSGAPLRVEEGDGRVLAVGDPALHALASAVLDA